MRVADVAVLVPVDHAFTYSIPDALEVAVGTRVWAPFGGRGAEGVVLDVRASESPNPPLRPLVRVIDAPALDPALVALARWVSHYYVAPVGEAVRLLLPPAGRARDASRVALTDDGALAAAGLGRALEPPALDGLALRERTLLAALAAAGGEAPVRALLATVERGAPALATLRARHLVVDRADAEARRVRQETWVRALAPPERAARRGLTTPAASPVSAPTSTQPDPDADAASAALARAPRRRALLDLLRAAPELSLSSLRAIDPRAAEHVRALVAAGLAATRTAPVGERPPSDAALDSAQPIVPSGADAPTAAVSSDPAPRIVVPHAAAAAPSPLAATSDDPPPAIVSAPASAATAAPAPPGSVPPSLTPAQRRALAALAPAIAARRYAPFLLHGVTGSGKTEVYLHAIAAALADGRGALALVPEISLTPQLAARFRARFGDDVAVLHSGLSDRDRFDAWVRLRDGRTRIALGARSAVFAPVPHLGVVVVDEEHDPSFKQEEGVRYHARDVALRRARDAGAVALLGSATPAIEVYHAALDGRLALLELPERATPRPLPSVDVIDLRRHRTGPDGFFSAPLAAALERTLVVGEQAILFLNRRGYSTFIVCTACGHRFSCRHCSVTLTYHRGTDRLACHYCGYLEAAPARCPACQSRSVARLGLGTEKVAAVVAERFPTARVARLDRDTAQGRGTERILAAVRAGTVDVLVGTQMITKGHDFPGVTLVGVVLADQSMSFPDFRSSERTFQLLEQVAGRAGRGDRAGRVLVQTWSPEHPAVVRAQDHDYRRFFDDERAERVELRYPPFTRLGAVRVDGPDPDEVKRVIEAATASARTAARSLGGDHPGAIELLGPAEAPLARLKGRTRWQLLVKADDARALRAVLVGASRIAIPSRVRLVVDVDPVSAM